MSVYEYVGIEIKLEANDKKISVFGCGGGTV
jgi:hypothetical protein